MGCWNGTCFVSNISIREGEDVVGFIIKYKSDESPTYLVDNAEPISLPIFGKYDGYGILENIKEDWSTNHIVKQFQEYIENKKYEAVYDEYYVNEGTSTIEQILRIVERGFIIKQTNPFMIQHKPEEKFALVMCLKYIYDNITYSKDIEYWDTFLKQMEEKKKLPTEIEELEKNLILNKKDNDLSDSEKLHKSYLLELYNNYLSKQHTRTIYGASLFNKMTDPFSFIFGNSISWFINYADDFNENTPDIISRYGSFFYILSDLRKTWRPQSGNGSQHDNYNNILKLNSIIKTYCERNVGELEDCLDEE